MVGALPDRARERVEIGDQPAPEKNPLALNAIREDVPHGDTVMGAKLNETSGGTLYRVKKTSIYIDASLDAGVARLAAARGVTKAEAIRQILARAVNDQGRVRISAIGVGAGPGDVADELDRHLSETGFGES